MDDLELPECCFGFYDLVLAFDNLLGKTYIISSGFPEVEEVIRLDPTLVFRLLRLVNSPYYGLRQKVQSISQALMFLGTKNLRNLVLMDNLKDVFKDDQKREHFSRIMSPRIFPYQ